MLNLQSIALRRGNRLLFDDADLQVHPGHKIGVTGANGTGKSSLFSLIRGDLTPDSGQCALPKEWVLAQVKQETPASDATALDYALDGDGELRAIEHDMAQADGEHLAELLARYESIGGYQAQAKAGRLLHGLGFQNTDLARPVKDFSGGWRMRLNLAQALMCRSDLLLLDEPTNHLDIDAVIWLESWLRSYAGALLLISHDRDFLDAVVTRITHIEHGKMTVYTGNYSAFERIRAERLANQQAEHAKQQRIKAQMQSFVDRFRAKATKAKQAQSRLKALARMTEIAPAHVDSPFRFRFRQPEKTPIPLLQLDQAELGYDDKTILHQVTVTLVPGDRIALLGANGAGKSTLVKALAGVNPILAGERKQATDLKLGYFAQHQLEHLHPEHSPLDHMKQLDGQTPEQQLRDFLGGFGFLGDMALAKVAPFSGGEKARLALALIVWQKPNLLLLDEPTNHLDLEMRQALSESLLDYQGAIVVVSHDRHLLRVTTDQLLIVHDGQVQNFEGELDDYPAWLAAREKIRAQNEAEASELGTKTDSKKAKRQSEAAKRQSLKPLRDKIKKLEKQLNQRQSELDEIETILNDPSIYTDPERQGDVETLSQRRGLLTTELETLEEAWLEASDALENTS